MNPALIVLCALVYASIGAWVGGYVSHKDKDNFWIYFLVFVWPVYLPGMALYFLGIRARNHYEKREVSRKIPRAKVVK